MTDVAKKSSKLKIAYNVISTTAFVALAVFCIVCIIATVQTKKNNGVAKLFGYQILIVTSESMEANPATDTSAYKIKSAPKGSAVFVKGFKDDDKQKFYDELAVGDVITFNYFDTVNRRNITVTHRIVEKTEYADTGVYYIVTRGDNNPAEITESFSSSDNVVYGKVTRVDNGFGKLLSFLQTTKGIMLVIVLPVAVMMLLEIASLIWTIVGVVSEKKAKAMAKDLLREAVDIIAENDENAATADEIAITVNGLSSLDEPLIEAVIPPGPIPSIIIGNEAASAEPVLTEEITEKAAGNTREDKEETAE